MSEDEPRQRLSSGQPHLTERARREAEERRARQARSLKANLARRKAQGRARADGAGAGESLPESLENKD